MKNKELETKLKRYLTLNYPMVLTKDIEQGIFFVEYLDLPGCLSHGETPVDAIKFAEEVKEEWIKDALEKGHPVPEPKKEEKYSGKFIVRIPRTLHKRLSQQAEREGRSLNQHVGILLSERSAALEVEKILNGFTESQAVLKKTIEEAFPKRVASDLHTVIASIPERGQAESCTPSPILSPATQFGGASTILKKILHN